MPLFKTKGPFGASIVSPRATTQLSGTIEVPNVVAFLSVKELVLFSRWTMNGVSIYLLVVLPLLPSF